ncbi:MAG: 4-hydroxy-tetrahydrodipicolinate synthase [Clostridia bacterium]|nr:4-hydroxy-tetrahydrodipicolinate synthase [Clostridia bacterium]
MKPIIFTGAAVAIITPFDENGIDFESFGKIIDDQIDGGTDAIVVCGTTGESATMPDAEHLSAIEYCVKRVAGRVPVIAGTGSNDTKHCIELSKGAEALGVDALLLVTPYYNKTTQRGLIQHYTMVANAVKLPIILYNVPSRTGVNIQPKTLKELSKVENIVAVKEASGDISQVAKIAQLCGDDMTIYSGNDDQIVPIMSLGGKGVISVLSNVAPRQTHDIVASYMEGDVKKSLKLQLEAIELVDALFVEVNPIPVKTAMNMLGYKAGNLRMPLYEMSEENKETLRKAMVNYGLLK